MDRIKISETQLMVMRYIKRHSLNGGCEQIAGYGRASWLSASRALVRKGLARNGRTGHYGLTEAGHEYLAELAKET